MSREAAYDGIFQLLKSVTGITNSQRRYAKPEAITSADMPCLLQWQKQEISEGEKQIHGTPIKTILEIDVLIYVHCAGDEWPSSVINPLLDKIDLALKPQTPADRTNTLGGAVQWVYRGSLLYGEHSDGNQIAVRFPIHMLIVP